MDTQLNALLIKNIKLASRQKSSLICQIITPILCLLYILLVKVIVQSQISKTRFSLKLFIPYLFNIPLYSKLRYSKQIISTNTCDEWYIYDFIGKANNTESKKFFGYNEGEFNEESTSMLSRRDNIIQKVCPDVKKYTPYFKELKKVRRNNSEININHYLYNTLDELNKYNATEIKRNVSVLNKLPDGAITINELDSQKFSYKIQINDVRVIFYHRANGVTLLLLYNNKTEKYNDFNNAINGGVWVIDLFNKAYIKKLFPKVKLISGVQIMPMESDDNEVSIQRLINMVGSMFYPISISLLLPLFMYGIVIEKETKLIEIMKINGLKMRYYWISNFIFNFCHYVITMIFFVLFGAFVIKLTFFTRTHPLLLFLLFFGWGFSQIGLSIFFQSFLSKARSATIIGYMVTLWTIILAVILNATVFNFPNKHNIALLLYPTFSLCRLIYTMTHKCGYSTCISKFSEVDEELKLCLILLYVMGVFFLFLGIYLYEVLPQEYGVRKSPLLCLKNCFKKKPLLIDSNNEGDNSLNNNLINEANIDVKDNESNEIINKSDYPLVVENLTKIYPSNLDNKSMKKSLDNLSLVLKKNEIFGLLGPNGAGKTTFFSILCGIYEPTSGNAFIKGNSIKDDISKVQELIGYCPQFDILWPDLNVEDHLYFYSKLKNVPSERLNENVETTLRNTKLTKFRKFLVSELSGGMKRRLSLGISLVGNPSIVFLDEPTTGLDPKNKRQIWEILEKCKENKCLILTTHLMDEAEILSDRIGIIVHGHLKCVGDYFTLKKDYGKGFKLFINLIPFSRIENLDSLTENEFYNQRKENIISFIKNLINDVTLSESYNNFLIFEIPNSQFHIDSLFNEIEANKNTFGICNWTIAQISLEDIFIKLTENEL